MMIKTMLDKYQFAAARTINHEGGGALNEYVLGLMGESGEVIDCIKKHLYHGHGLAHMAEEIGDVFWYLAAICGETGCGSFGDCYTGEAPPQKTLFWLANDIWSDANKIRGFLLVRPSAQSKMMIRAAVGDMIATCEILCSIPGFRLSKILDANIKKLWERYPDKFSATASLDRKK